MKQKCIVYLTILLVTLVSCNTEAAKKQKEQKLAEEVMAVHDEIMPKMDIIFKLRKDLKNLANERAAWNDSVGTEDPSLRIPESVMSENAALIRALDSSDKAMMDWMHNYNGGEGIYDHEEIMAYLNEEKNKIMSVRELMLKSIQDSENYLSREEKNK
jgi:hypothetical protein